MAPWKWYLPLLCYLICLTTCSSLSACHCVCARQLVPEGNALQTVDWVPFASPCLQNLWCKRPRAGRRNLFCIASNTLEFDGFRRGVLLKFLVMMKVIYEFKSWIRAGVLVSSEAWNCSAQVLDSCHGYINVSVSTVQLCVSTVHKQIAQIQNGKQIFI